MTENATLRCRCGEVRGLATNVSPDTVNRVICYCDDCQAFAHYLGRADLLDAHGGSDIVQLAPACLSFVQGEERIAGLHLTPKGLYRWYASCCKTPLGNMVTPAIPYIGIVVQAFASEAQNVDDLFGRPIGAVYGRYAVDGAPASSTRFSPRLVARAIRLLFAWRLRGQSWPHPFFERETRKPSYPVTALANEEREALRPLCGPHPTVRSD